MSDVFATLYPELDFNHPLPQYIDPAKLSSDFSFFDPTPNQIEAPTPDTFDTDLELDTDLQLFDEQVQLFELNNPIAPPREAGPPSVFSESAYESVANSESVYYSPYAPSNYSLPVGMSSFNAMHLSDYGASERYNARILGADMTATSFGALPPSPPVSPPTRAARAQSDYGAALHGQRRYPAAGGHPSVSPISMSPQLPIVPPVPSVARSQAGSDYNAAGDARGKIHHCPTCNRGFARAYNLKTHMDTHSSDRVKPYACPHRSCGRSFSRKHDLQRHRAAIHRDSSTTSTTPSARIGVESGMRARCEDCGKSWVTGQQRGCDCRNVK
ncbi:hypothetical protein FA95DRAFT_1555379 [Auriscalpium vulgare]|uniref:Uncharacterized protein n=1 Tax=Auriscalpium vulgare TaxID=40419 RepID=A0ACB8S4E4_9AGAM|nr:hypothetical protein FA95DRAFT_1555379 [Auriscalpium vulgare]